MSIQAIAIRSTIESAVDKGHALGMHYGFEEGRNAVLRFLLDEIDAGRSEQSLMALYVKIQALTNPNPNLKNALVSSDNDSALLKEYFQPEESQS